MCCFLLVGILILSFSAVEGFRSAIALSRSRPNAILFGKPNHDIEAALVPLTWEGLEASASQPVLNLSGRDDSPEDAGKAQETSNWDQGQLWAETQQGLKDRGIAHPDDCLEKCPQLLRLAPTMVLESADLVLEQYGLAYLKSERRLLAYKSEQIIYGLEFMSTMMMMDATVACKASPALLLSGIEGGIQEKAVQSALGAAGAATSQANQRIVGDAMAALQSLKKPKGLL